MSKTYIVPGKRTPFVKAGSDFAQLQSHELAVPVVQAMAEQARPDLLAFGQVIPNPQISNLGRELLLDAGLDADIPAFSNVLACSTSMLGTIQTAGMLGKGGLHLGLVGGTESMSHVPIALKPETAQKLTVQSAKDPTAAQQTFQSLTPQDFDLPVRGWANRISGRSMGEHTEDTAQRFGIAREDQDRLAEQSHARSIKAREWLLR